MPEKTSSKRTDYVAIRFEADDAARIDRQYRRVLAELERSHIPGRVSKVDLVRQLVRIGLESMESGEQVE